MRTEQEIERLEAENAELRRLLATSQEQLTAALARIVELEGELKRRTDLPKFVKRSRPKREGPRPERKKRSAEHNTSRKREEPTRIERHALDECPECGYGLSGESVGYRRQVIELPAPQPVEVIEHQVIKRWCPHCETWRSPQLDLSGEVFGQGRIGVRIASLVVYMRTTLRLPVRQVQEYLATQHNLQLSVGEIVELTHATRRQLQPQADELLEQIRSEPVAHMDETGWREDGQNGYAWAVITDGADAVRYYEYNASRSHHVAQHLLGSRFRGVLVSDFYAAYNLIPGRHQRCWVHLLRDLHKLKEEHAEATDVVEWATAVRQLYEEAQGWLRTHAPPTLEERSHKYASLLARVCELGQRYAFASGHPCRGLAKRLLRHQEELFQFVLVPNLPADNNLAERSIRPLVVIRKISGGSRSPEGTKTRLTLASLCATWKARGLNALEQCLAALQQVLTATQPAPTKTSLP